MKFWKAFLFLIVVFPMQSFASNTNDRLLSSIRKIVDAFHQSDSATLNSMIDSTDGVAILYATGAYPNYAILKHLSFQNPIPERSPYDAVSFESPIQQGDLPTYSCDDSKWDKTGVYFSTKGADHLFSDIAKVIQKEINDNITDDEITRIK